MLSSHQPVAFPELAADVLAPSARAASWHVRICRAVLRALHESRSKQAGEIIARYRHLSSTAPGEAEFSRLHME